MRFSFRHVSAAANPRRYRAARNLTMAPQTVNPQTVHLLYFHNHILKNGISRFVLSPEAAEIP